MKKGNEQKLSKILVSREATCFVHFMRRRVDLSRNEPLKFAAVGSICKSTAIAWTSRIFCIMGLEGFVELWNCKSVLCHEVLVCCIMSYRLSLHLGVTEFCYVL